MSTTRVGRNPWENPYQSHATPPWGPAMFQEPRLLTPPPQQGWYGLRSSMDPSETLTPTTPGGHGAPVTCPSIFGYGTNLVRHPTYLDSPPPTSIYPKSSLFTTLTASPYHRTWADLYQYAQLAPGWSYPIPPEPPFQVLGQEDSPMNLMPRILTPIPQTFSPTNSKSDSEGRSTPSDMTIKEGSDDAEILSIPTEMTTTWPDLGDHDRAILGPE